MKDGTFTINAVVQDVDMTLEEFEDAFVEFIEGLGGGFGGSIYETEIDDDELS